MLLRAEHAGRFDLTIENQRFSTGIEDRLKRCGDRRRIVELVEPDASKQRGFREREGAKLGVRDLVREHVRADRETSLRVLLSGDSFDRVKHTDFPNDI